MKRLYLVHICFISDMDFCILKQSKDDSDSFTYPSFKYTDNSNSRVSVFLNIQTYHNISLFQNIISKLFKYILNANFKYLNRKMRSVSIDTLQSIWVYFHKLHKHKHSRMSCFIMRPRIDFCALHKFALMCSTLLTMLNMILRQDITLHYDGVRFVKFMLSLYTSNILSNFLIP